MSLMETINNNIRGGTSCIFQPYAKANNPRVLPKTAPGIPKEQHDRIRAGFETDWTAFPSDYKEWCKKEGYDHEAEVSWIIYIDANGLYPTTMCMPLPIGDYQKIDIERVEFNLSLSLISEPTVLRRSSFAVFCVLLKIRNV